MLLNGKRVLILGEGPPADEIAAAFLSAGAQVLAVDGSTGIDGLVSRSGSVDILVTLPPPVTSARFLDSTQETIADVMATAFLAPAQAVHAVLPGMIERQSGSIVNVVAPGAERGLPGAAVAAAAAAAVAGLTRSVGEELKGSGVRINCIAPGPVDVPSFIDPALTAYEVSQGNDLSPMRTVTNAVLFLASDMSAGVSCQIVTARGANRW